MAFPDGDSEGCPGGHEGGARGLPPAGIPEVPGGHSGTPQGRPGGPRRALRGSQGVINSINSINSIN